MRIFQAVVAFFIATLVGSVLEAVEREPLWANISWDMSPLSDPLTEKQILFLNLYMQYPLTPEMNKLPRYVKNILPLYIELHSEELDSYALQYFRVKQLLSSGLTFSDVMALQSCMRDLQLGHSLKREQNVFLDGFIQKNLKKFPQLSLIPLLNPLFFHVTQVPSEFHNKARATLREALLKSIGFSSKEMSVLDVLVFQPLSSSKLSDVGLQALRKWLTLSFLHAAIEVYDAGQILRLQAVIHKNAEQFSQNAIAFLDNEVSNSRVVHRFRYTNFQASLSQLKDSDFESVSYNDPVQVMTWENPGIQQVH